MGECWEWDMDLMIRWMMVAWCVLQSFHWNSQNLHSSGSEKGGLDGMSQGFDLLFMRLQ